MDKLYTILKKIVALILKPLISIEKKNSKYSGMTARIVVDVLSEKTSKFFQYFNLEKQPEVNNSLTDRAYEQIAIILQGPILYDDDFTLTTARYYKKLYPGVKVIVSTWDTEKKEFIEKCKTEGIECIVDSLPLDRGAGNLNCQIKSSRNGVNYAKSLGVSYIAKTRTDQRFSYTGWLDYVINLVSAFPADGSLQESRLVFLESNGSYKYIAFHLCDFFLFGKTEDVCQYFDMPYDTRDINYFKDKAGEIEKVKKPLFELEYKNDFIPIDYENIEKELIEYQIAEFYLLYSYVKNNLDCIDSHISLLESYWKFLQQYAVIADSFQMQFYWPKYRRKYELQSKKEKTGKLDFAAWLDLYRHALN